MDEEEKDPISIDTLDIDLGAQLGDLFGEEQQEKKPEQTVKCQRGKETHFMRRVLSEFALEKTLPWHFEKGASYHCLSNGDVDSLTYLRVIVKQQRVPYVLLSAWCIAMTDAIEIKNWLDAGYIERIDFYLGDLFNTSYKNIYEYIKENCVRNGGRVCIFKSHAKVMAGFGERFDFIIEGSANINTNPRCENTAIVIDEKCARFFKEWFDGINAWNIEDCQNWQPLDIDNWEPYLNAKEKAKQ